MSPAERDARYERRDADARRVILAGFVLALLLGAALAASAWVSQGMEERVVSEDARRSPPSPLGALRTAPSGPELQPVPARELEQHRRREEERLRTTAWIDPVNRIVRIPIERAIELSLAEGFPVRPGPGKEAPR